MGGEDGKSKPLADAVSVSSLVAALAWSVPALALLLVTQDMGNVLLAVLLPVAMVLWLVRLFGRRLQGFTGDGLGAAQQLTELAIYLALAVQW